MPRVNYEIVGNRVGVALIIRDIGPWDIFQTVTNAAEQVVIELVDLGLLPEGRRLFYYDSDNQFDELVIVNSKFSHFK